MTFFYLSLAGLVAILSIRKHGDSFAPWTFFILLYSILLAVWSLKLSPAQTPWSPTSSYLFWGCTFIFLSGCAVVFIVNKIFRPLQRTDFNATHASIKEDAQHIDWHHFETVLAICLVFFLVSYAISAWMVGIPAFGGNADADRLKFYSATFLTNIGLFAGPIAITLGIELLLFKPQKTKKQLWVIWIVLIITITLNILILIRGDVFRFFFAGIIFYHYGKKKLTLKHLGMILAIGTILFMIYFLLRSTSHGYEMLATSLKLRLPDQYAWASNIFAYFTCNFWNFDFAISKFVEGNQPYPMGYGYYLLRPLFFFTHTEGAMSQMFGFEGVLLKEIIKVKGLNTIIYPWLFYADFGAWGAFGLTLIAAAGITFFYVNMIAKPTLKRLSIWGIIIYLLFFSFINWFWSFWFIWVTIAVFLFAHKTKSPNNHP